MKVVYRILEKEQRGGSSYRLRGEIFFTSRKKAVDYMHKKFMEGHSLKYKKGEYLVVTTAPEGSNWVLYDTKRYTLDMVPVN